MQWEKDARQSIDQIPIHDSIRKLLVVWAEKLARQRQSGTVTMEDVRQTGSDYSRHFGAEKMKKIGEARRSGLSDTDLDIQDSLNREPALFRIELCHSRFFGCPNDLIDVKELGARIRQKLEELSVTEIIADKAREVLMPHSMFTVSVSGCSNMCTAPESKELGIHGVARPVVTARECSECGRCLTACLDRIISLHGGRPVINFDYCRLCGACIRACPTGAIAASTQGVRILAGGTIGRFARYGREIFKMTDSETIFGVLEALALLLKSEWSEDHEDHFSLLLSRIGVAPLYEHMGITGCKTQPK